MDDRIKKLVDSAYSPVEFEHDKFGNLSGATFNLDPAIEPGALPTISFAPGLFASLPLHPPGAP